MGIEPDWPNVRLDVLEIPDDQDLPWLEQAEEALIRYFRLLFNTSLQPAARQAQERIYT